MSENESGPEDSPLSYASETCMNINDALADDGLTGMVLTGRIGFHTYPATDEGVGAYWQTALYMALSDLIEEEIHIPHDHRDPRSAKVEVEDGLRRMGLDSFTADYVADEFAENLASLMESGGDGE